MFDHSARVSRLQELMGETGVDVTLLSVGADMPYFMGYEAMPSERLTVAVVPKAGIPTLVVPRLEAARVQQGEFEVLAWGETEDPVAMAVGTIDRPSDVAVGDHMWAVFLTRFQESWPQARWRPASELTSRLRVVKDSREVEMLRAAAHAIDRVMARIPGEVRFSGRTERDVARQLSEMAVEEGHDQAEFAIVASGPNGASPHHHPGDQSIAEGDLVVCDFGGRWEGYFSDTTRTVSVGQPSARQRDVHEVVLAANEAGRAAVAPGVQCLDVDRAARAIIGEAGMGKYFIHRTGHGIGLEVHEHPYIVDGNETPLQPGMTFSIEPGVYIPGELGVRIEDIVVCGESGADSLNEADRGLIIAS